MSKTTASILFAMVATLALAGCGGTGNTDGGSAADAAVVTDEFVSDGAAGGTLVITTTRETIPTAGRIEFKVTATGADGAPLAFIRIFCESEKGIAIIEPSSGGVAFESTNAGGIMSGVLGGLTPGSFLLECRGPQGFNLVARRTFKVEGEVPIGFTGFPGAAGGNLGGGVLVDDPNPVAFVIVNDGITSIENLVDIVRDSDCNLDGAVTTDDIEDFTFDQYFVTFDNSDRTQDLFISSVRFSVGDGQGASSTTLFNEARVPAGGTLELSGLFTEFLLGAPKLFASTSIAAIPGTYPVTFTISGTSASGDGFTVTAVVSVTFDGVDNC